MVLPVAIFFTWVLIQRDHQGTRVTLAFVILGIYLAIRLSLGFSFSLPPSVFSYDAPWDIRWLLAFKVLALYFLALLNPFEMPHSFWSVQLPTSLSEPYVLSGMLISVLLILAIWAVFKRSPMAAFGLIWFAIYFFPISNIKQLNQPMAEHWLYIPMIGLCLAAGAVLDVPRIRLLEIRLLRLGVLTTAATFLVFAALVAREKTRIYQDDETFLLAAIRANPNVAKLYSILGSTYLAREDVSRAKEFYGKALNLDPNDFVANYRTGFLFYQEGEPKKAEVYLAKVVRSEPRPLYEILPVAHAWEMLGDRQKAVFYYRKGLKLDPHSARIQQKVAALEAQ